MCVYTYVCIYIYIHTYSHIYIYIYTHTFATWSSIERREAGACGQVPRRPVGRPDSQWIYTYLIIYTSMLYGYTIRYIRCYIILQICYVILYLTSCSCRRVSNHHSGWPYLSNVPCLNAASFVICVFRRIKDHHPLL